MQVRCVDFFKKNACEIFHDDAIFADFRRKKRLLPQAAHGVSAGLGKMRLLRIILVWVILVGAPLVGFAADSTSPAAEPGQPAEAHEKEHSLPQEAVHITKGAFPISNSMIVTWIVAAGLIIFAQIATRNMKEIPDGAQNFWEWMVESLHDFLEASLDIIWCRERSGFLPPSSSSSSFVIGRACFPELVLLAGERP